MMVRYTDAVALAVAVVAVLGVWRLVPGALPRGAAAWWLASVALALALVLSWDTVVYGGATRTGYAAGVVTFGWGAVRGNLENLPRHLATSMPASLLALGALVWLGVRSVRLRRTAPEGAVRPSRRSAHRDLAVAAALTAVWWGVWGLYFTYYWTAQMGGGPGGGAAGAGAPFGLGGPPGAGAPPGLAGGSQAVHLVRFFVPALAPVALLGAWALARLPRWLSLVALAGSFGLGFWSFAAMASADARGGIMGDRPGGPGGFPGVPPAGPGAPGGEPSGP
jgi:hypothetical protein